jgi:hypothetical protein
MTDKKMYTARKNIIFINGNTTINHRIRVKLGLSCDQYVFLWFIKEHNEKNPGERMLNKRVHSATGFHPDDFKRLYSSLIEPDFISKRGAMLEVVDKYEIKTTSIFNRPFEMLGDFDAFWKIGPVGNRAAAKKHYLKSCKIIDHEELAEHYRKYIAHCEKTGGYKKHTSSWLNPAFRYWEDILIDEKAEQEKKKQKQNEGEISYDFKQTQTKH